jgi:DNA-directed RNA polymerase subunit RPC12/RpoP
MDNENEEEIKQDEDKTCPLCGLRQYGKICANCNAPIEEEVDLDKRKEDESDEYDWRERR